MNITRNPYFQFNSNASTGLMSPWQPSARAAGSSLTTPPHTPPFSQTSLPPYPRQDGSQPRLSDFPGAVEHEVHNRATNVNADLRIVVSLPSIKPH